MKGGKGGDGMENLQKPVELEKGVYWLGIRSESRLEINVYLRVFKGNNKATSMIIDPGPPVFFSQIFENMKGILGNPPKPQIAFINHQDPDVGTNAMFLQKQNPKLMVICTEDTWRLTHFFDLNPATFQATEKFKNGRARLSTGHIVRFVPTPFCHFRGACMLYDEESRILFSGDLFGGLTFAPDLFATSENWDGMRIFHQIYMPSREALRIAIDRIRQLQPAPKMIAPQHGAIIRGDLIKEFLDKMYELPVGLDLIKPTAVDKEIYLRAINEILDDIALTTGRDLVDKALKQFATDGSFPSLLKVKAGKVLDVKEDNVIAAFRTLVELLLKGQPPQTQILIKDAVRRSKWNLPLVEEEEGEAIVSPDLFMEEAK
jgi:glyoxylase-like metal-dependent hydrolase (beta-lactamase superfamily II)